MLEDLRPLLAQLDPALRQLNPILDFLGLYKRELTAFFANTVAATQASTVSTSGRVHYLRTTNPLNPENLAVYPQRIGTNRPNPYSLPGTFDQLAPGHALVRDAPLRPRRARRSSTRRRRCRRRPLPPLSIRRADPESGAAGEPAVSYPTACSTTSCEFAFPQAQRQRGRAALRQQGPFTVQGETSQYPHVKPD